MGHERTGRLPNTPGWRRVSELLQGSPYATRSLVAAIVDAAEDHLHRFADDPILGYSYWLISRIASASWTDDFLGELEQVGLHVTPDTSVLGLVSQVAERVGQEMAAGGPTSHLSELSALATRRALMDTVTDHNLSLFGSSLDELQLAFRSQATGTGFAHLARRFFADLLGRTLRTAIDRELPNRVGPGESIKSVADSAVLTERVDAYARDSAGVMEEFAEDWYASRNWPERRQITRDEAQAFVAHAVEKLRTELQLASGQA